MHSQRSSIMKLSFADNMWDGLEAIKEKTDVGLKSCRDVLEFFRKLATIEEEYSKNLSALMQRYPASNSNLTLSQGWKGVVTVLEGKAAAHKNLSVNTVTNLCHPLQALLKDMENRRKQLVLDGAKQKTDLRDTTELVKKAQAKYVACAKDLETARKEWDTAKRETNPQSAKLTRIEKNVAAKESENNMAETQYKLQVSASNQFLDSHQNEKWPNILNEFEQFEVTRISFMKANIYNFMGLLKEMPSVLEGEVTTGLACAEQIDPDIDLQIYIDQNKQPKELVKEFSFEPYQVGQKVVVAAGSRPISQIWANLGFSSGPKEEVKPTVFGISLSELMDKQKDDPSLQIPKVLDTLCQSIYSHNGANAEGIFRLAGSASEIQNLRKQLEKGDYSISGGDVHVSGTVMKQFLRELPEGVIPTTFYEQCVNNLITPAELFAKLPPINRTVLLYVLNFLKIIIRPQHLKHNKMNSANLATIFATVLLRSPQKDPSAVLAGLTNEFSFVEKMIVTAPLLDASEFTIFTELHQSQRESLSSPLSPPSPLSSVAYSTTTDPSCTSFEDLSSKDDPISDFSEADKDSGSEKDELRDSKGEGIRRSLANSEELPNEFVMVSDSPRKQDS